MSRNASSCIWFAIRTAGLLYLFQLLDWGLCFSSAVVLTSIANSEQNQERKKWECAAFVSRTAHTLFISRTPHTPKYSYKPICRVCDFILTLVHKGCFPLAVALITAANEQQIAALFSVFLLMARTLRQQRACRGAGFPRLICYYMSPRYLSLYMLSITILRGGHFCSDCGRGISFRG